MLIRGSSGSTLCLNFINPFDRFRIPHWPEAWRVPDNNYFVGFGPEVPWDASEVHSITLLAVH